MQVSRRLKKATAALQELFNGSNNSDKNTGSPIENSTKKTSTRAGGKKISRSSLGAKLRAKKEQDIEEPT